MPSRFPIFLFAAAVSCLLPRPAVAANDLPAPTQGDHVIKDYRFASGQTLPELELHRRTFGMPRRDAQGAVPILHGTRGHGTHTVAKVWEAELQRLLRASDPKLVDGGESETGKMTICGGTASRVSLVPEGGLVSNRIAEITLRCRPVRDSKWCAGNMDPTPLCRIVEWRLAV